MSKPRERLTYANVMATVAVFIALGGGAYAITLKKNSVKSKHIKDGQVSSADVADDGLTGTDILESSLTLPPGNAGPQGAQGPQGPQGAPGADGSPDTAQQILDKLLTTDGSGSNLDADTLDGQNAAAFLGATAKAADADLLDGQNSSAFLGATAKAADADFLDGQDSSAFLGATAKAADADLLDGQNSSAFLGATAKAADADKLDNLDSSAFQQTGAAGRSTGGGDSISVFFETVQFAVAGGTMTYGCGFQDPGAEGAVSWNGPNAEIWIDDGSNNPSHDISTSASRTFFDLGDHMTFVFSTATTVAEVEIYSHSDDNLTCDVAYTLSEYQK